MPSAFFGLDVALRALRAQQKAVDVTSHNIANANTPGYSRQVASMTTTSPYTVPAMGRDPSAGQLGTGVVVASVSRARDSFVDYQLRNELSAQGQWEAARDSLKQVEAIFNEPSTSGLNTLLGRFWQSWQELANSPTDAAVRANLIEQANALATAITYNYQQMRQLQQDLDRQIGLTVEEINTIAARLATLNAQVAQVELTGQRANDLADQRDLLLDQLTKLTRVTTAVSPNGMVQVFLGNRLLVDGTTAHSLRVAPVGPGSFYEVQWANGDPTSVSGGKLKGLLDQRDVALPQFMADLDGLAADLIDAVNGVHSAGFGLDDPGPASPGRSFFSGSGAADIAVAVEVATDPRKIAAAAQPNAPGDGSQALALAEALKTSGLDGKYQSLVAKLGVQVRAAAETVDNQNVLVRHLRRRREALSGVSLDEETVNMLKYQQAYEAAARVITAVDQMLDTLINRTGVVGR